MYATVNVSGLKETEQIAQEILEHIEAIKKLQLKLGMNGRIDVTFDLGMEKRPEKNSEPQENYIPLSKSQIAR